MSGSGTMRAVVADRDERRPRVIDVPRPTPGPGETLVRTLRVGIDGTDYHVIDGDHGGFPEGEAYMVLGHEAVGVVEDPNGTGMNEGDVVVPTVRRPVGASNPYYRRGELDMAPEGQYVERGIVGAHGFMSEYFTTPADQLVTVPASLAPYGFLVEPISNSEKAFELAFSSRDTFEWAPESALVLGNGPLGLLTLAMAGTRFERTYCLGRRDRPDPTIDVIERLGATYVDSRTTPVPEIPEVHEPIDFAYEATGYAKHAFDVVDALAPNGVAVLMGIPDDSTFEIDGGRLHRSLVLGNKAVVGSVNSSVPHFESAIESLSAFPDWLPETLLTGVYSPANAAAAFDSDRTDIKTVIEFNDPREYT